MTAETKETCGSVSLQETDRKGKKGVHSNQRDCLSSLGPRVGGGEIGRWSDFLQISQTLATNHLGGEWEWYCSFNLGFPCPEEDCVMI